MGTRITLYIKTAIIFSFLYGISSYITYKIFNWGDLTIWFYVFNVFFVGIVFSLIMVTIHLNSIRKYIGGKPRGEQVLPFGSSQLETNLTRDELLELIRNDPKFMHMHETVLDGKIKIETNKENYLGYILTITFRQINGGRFLLDIMSKSKWPLTVIDFGRNWELVFRMKDLIEKNSSVELMET